MNEIDEQMEIRNESADQLWRRLDGELNEHDVEVDRFIPRRIAII
jgi:hypothetical protein